MLQCSGETRGDTALFYFPLSEADKVPTLFGEEKRFIILFLIFNSLIFSLSAASRL